MPRVEARRRLVDVAGRALIVALAVAALAPLFHLAATVTVNGVEAIARSGAGFFTEPPNPTDPAHPGGIGPALWGTAMLVALSTLFAVALAIPAGVFIAEFRRAGISRATLLLTLMLMEFPTVLVGLTVYATVVRAFRSLGVNQYGYSMLAGAAALALVVLPYMAVQAGEALRHVPRELREAAYSLGASRLKTVYRVVLGIARRGIVVGVLIGVAKAAGETAPLLFTVGGFFNTYPGLLDPGGSVSLLIYEYAWQAQEGYHVLAWGAALVLLALVTAVMLAARLLVREVRL